jgi:hypothetical protein
MKHRKSRWMFALLITGLPLVAAPALAGGGGKSLGKASGVVPATLEEIPGSEVKRVTLTARAAERIDLKTEAVREAVVDGARQKVVPYSALIYDPHGGTWVYSVTGTRAFTRTRVDVAHIEGDRVYLKSGPQSGTEVASVGVAEIYGAETEVGH